MNDFRTEHTEEAAPVAHRDDHTVTDADGKVIGYIQLDEVDAEVSEIEVA